ncbi:fibrocystin-L-like [Lytechinus pictus]|uniref:fibrocystin-L-like n=1 Tax=Lytechinus pictus TaxID=7653 RepID=UPI0030BA281F
MASLAAGCRPGSGQGTLRRLLVFLVLTSCVASSLGAVPRVTRIDPRVGSLRGATRIEISGSGFSKDRFSFGQGNEDLGNKVYFRNSTTSIPCDVLDYYSNENKIVCETRTGSAGTYDIYVEVDGQSITDAGGSYCSSDSNCQFTYQSGRTPTIDYVTPTYNIPEQPLTIRGRIYTELYDATQLNEEDDDAEDLDGDDPLVIQRIYWGPQIICDPEDPETEAPYGIELDDEESTWGTIMCRPDTPLVGSYRLTYLVSGAYGRSLSDTDTLYVSGEDKLYHYQTHADISSVYPVEGSLSGGTDVTIEGRYFDYTDPDLAVYIGGVPCDIYNVSSTEILCRTNPADDNILHVNATVFPGGRGILREVWNSTAGDVRDDSDFDTSASDYCSHIRPFASSPDNAPCGESNNYVSRFRGFFVPPSDGYYAFGIQSDDNSVLYFSQTMYPADKVEIASSPSYSNSITRFEEQISAKMFLEGGKYYYMESRMRDYSGGDFMYVGVFLSNSSIISSQYEGATDEEQTITITSDVQNEYQAVTYGDGLYETQDVRVSLGCTGIFCDDDDDQFIMTTIPSEMVNTTEQNATTAESTTITMMMTTENSTEGSGSGSGFMGYFRLSYGAFSTDDIEVGASAMEVQDALNMLPLGNGSGTNMTYGNLSVTVTAREEGDLTIYRVRFNSFGAFSLLEDASYDTNVRVNISRVTAGAVNGTAVPSSFRLSYGGRISELLTFDSSADDVRNAVLDMITVKCESTSTGRPYYFVDYESAAVGSEFGTRVNDQEPFCGRTSLRNPNWVFYVGVMGSVSSVDLRYTSEFCLGHRGTGFERWFYVWVSWIDKSKSSRFNAIYINGGFVQNNNWQHTCVDLWDTISTSWISNEWLSGTGVYMERIRLYEKTDQEFWVDNIFVGVKEDSYGVRVPAARPNDNFILDASVEATNSGYIVELEPAQCGHNFPLIGIQGGQINAGSTDAGSDFATYSGRMWDDGASVTVSSVQRSTPPIQGTFNLAQEGGGEVYGISGQSTASQLKDALETYLDVGDLSVTRSGECTGYRYNIKWNSKGGSQGLLQVTSDDLYNNVTWANVTTARIYEGNVFLSKIPGEFLRTVNDHPQVEVIVNGIPSSCQSDSCSFQYTPAATPTLSSITPSSGSANAGTSVVIIGTGFSDNVGENNVTIGGADCTITDANATRIECDVGPAQGGVYNISVIVDGKGSASLPTGGVEFEYDFDVTSITPDEGSAAGGTEVTISGYGLGGDNDIEVAIGSNDCEVVSSSYDEIVCVIVIEASSRRRRRSTTDADIVISIEGVSALTVSNGFTFDTSLTPTVTSLSPTTSSVVGGDDLTISGSAFGSSGASVMIGSASCEVTDQSDSSITCVLPANVPGEYEVDVEIESIGLADTSAIDPFSYVLDVTGMFPSSGSVQGGTEVTLTGAGFGTDPNNITVTMGGFECQVTAIDDDELTCTASSSSANHRVDNLGRHSKYGIGYKWNPQLVTITAGDSVTWSWTIDPYVNGIGYAVQQTANGDSVGYDGSGFYSGGRSTSSGSYTYQFDVPGTYYYSSGGVRSDGTIFMKGVVEVLPVASVAMELDVVLGGFSANHDVNSGESDPTGGGACSYEDNTISGCSSASPNITDDTKFNFIFDECMTPTISNIAPLIGDSSDTIVIEGSGFSDQDCANVITVGQYPCVTTSSSSTRLECEIDTQDEMEVGVYHEIAVNVANRGFAIQESHILANRSFVMYPKIDSVSDSDGSIRGGLTLVIQGDGFAPASASNIAVYLGSLSCGITYYNYTYIECTTPSSSVYGSQLVRVQVNSLWAVGGSSFNYTELQTPSISDWSPGIISGSGTTSMTFSGSKLSSSSDDISITIGGEACSITTAGVSEVECDIGAVPVGTQDVLINVAGKGLALFDSGNDTVESEANIFSVSPSEGSTQGGQLVNISGNGFVNGATEVTIDGSSCDIQSISLSEIHCISPANSAGTYDLVVTSDGVTYDTEDYVYSSSSTPTVTSITPGSGETGSSITISGSAFSDVASDITITIDGVECSITSAASSQIECDLGAHSAGVYDVMIHVVGLGDADNAETFEYELTVSSTSPSTGSFGGGQTLVIEGSGFDSETTMVTVCGIDCPLYSANETTVECDLPGNSDSSSTLDCDIVVSLASGSEVNETDAYQYRRDMTPVIDSVFPARGGTGGGTTVTITGQDFLDSGNEVTIAGTSCSILSENSTVITCQTGAHSPSERSQVRVQVGSNGIATQDNADYFYIDVWSSVYTWGGNDPPIEGDFVIIPQGQTILLDVTTPILSVLLIQGGEMIFDEADIELHAEYVVVTDGGHFEIGTEDEPFQHEASVVMHGHVRSIELPLFGAKTFAVRNGTVDMHGIPTPITWSYLAETVSAGDTELTLMDSVNWRIGDHIVLASTGTRHKQTQNEEVEITGFSNDNMTIEFTPAVEFDHISVSQVIDGVLVETRGEVGLLTHNVKIRGSVHEEWVEEVEACPDEFDTNQFATQTCFQGRFGAETVTDQFGSQIMFFAKEQDTHLVRGRFEYVEVTHAGQAFRLGRYPIHYHMNGNITGSYVRGCGIHHTFNRAVTIHGVHHLLVEHNVAFNVMGHAFFLEDGIETKNIIQYNLAVFVRPSSSLLNVDVTPASFWVTNPDNYIRHNAAAGGSHFGFWYNMPSHPGGPSFTTSVCPRNVQVLEFYNNTAHTMGWYGIWIFPTYFPTTDGSCGGTAGHTEFHNLTAWRTERGAEGVLVGPIQFHNFLMTDNEKSGIEFQTVGSVWGDDGPMVKDSVIIGYTPELAEGQAASRCTSAGIHLPKSKFLTVDGVKFINFDEDRCVTLRACAHCKPRQGGFQHRFKNLIFTDSPNKAAFQWEHETWFEDMDGTLTGNADYIVTPKNNGLPSDNCDFDMEGFNKGVDGAVCDESVKLHRMAFNQAFPTSLNYKNTIMTNSHGTTVIPYKKKRLTHPTGWMLTLVETETYNFYFENVDHVTNISYSARFDEFSDGDYVIMNHNFTQSPDAFALTGQVTENVGRPLDYVEDENGEWYFNNMTNNLFYLISGKDQNSPVSRSVNLDVYRCYYKDCIPPVPEAPPAPPDGRPNSTLYWSDAAAWEDVTEGWGGNTGSGSSVPENGDNVMIYPGRWIVANDTLPWMHKLFIYGTLEIDDSKDMVINATYILIQGGRLIAGFNETRPFTHELRIILNGHHFTQDIPLPNGPNLGSKALGVFGTLDLHGVPRDVTWTHLASTVEAGDSEFTVAVDTDWRVGDEIVVTTTSYEQWHTETFRISSKTNARTFSVNGTFAHMHTVESAEINGKAYTIAAEVGLLTRNIVIEGNDYDLLFDESFGARTIVGSFIQDGEFYRGSGHFANIEFKLTGQEGWTDFYDPRYSLAFLDIGDVLEDAVPSYVHSCTFHNGFSLAIGVFGTDNIEIDNNVIHHSVGSGIKTYGTNTMITNNLVSLMVFPGTYQDRFETENIDWMGGIDVVEATNPILINNTVAGSERVGFNIKGELCSDPNVWSNNVAHSNYHGVHILKTGRDPCTKVNDFFSYRNLDYGLYALTPSTLEVTESIFVDNTAGMLVHDYGPSALSHVRADKHVLLKDSLVVGYSDSFDCDVDKVTPEGAAQSSKQRATKSPNGGTVGVYFTSFKGSSGGAPFKPFTSVMSYPAISGRTILQGVTFANFNDKCSSGDKVIMTSPQSGDAMHPMEVEGLTFVDTPTKNYIWIHRPALGLVNPSDCVDMDCDGMKKAMIKDHDGSLLGSPGSVIPDSAFEWDGDPRRGLGDYRIPKMMLTTPDGARIPKNDIAPNNGIIRNDDCEWSNRWQAWECHGLDHMMMIVESMDADTEVRRVSPVALHADGYVDLINGPQDHGWCLGYTCQERVSTFNTIVATGKNYELFFTGTNPQSLRFHLLNANESQALTVGIWYANPQRLDVYVNGLYIIPNNGQYVNGGLQWIAPSAGTDFMPSLDSMVLGENYFDREYQTLHILVRGSTYVEIRTTPVVITTFGVPAVEVDDFFEENLVENLANLLNIDESQIRVVEIISEASRKKRSTGSDTEVVIEIGANPVASVSTDDNNGTTPAPSGTAAPTELSFDDLTDVQAMLADEMQTGNLGDSLGITISSMSMTDPVDTPKDPTGGVRATNMTGGPANGTTTFAEQQAMEEELALETVGQPTVYVVASTMVLEVQPDDAIEHSDFGIQPRIKVLDNQGNRIEQLGTPTSPWQVTATISSMSSEGNIGFNSDNQTISFSGGWANFTDLGVNISATDLVLQFTIIYPNTSSLTVSSEPFDVDVQPYHLEIITAPSSDVIENEPFEVIVELRETQTGDVPTNLADKGFDSWPVTISISDPTNYRGELVGDLSTPLDLSTAQASFTLSINEASYYYILDISVVTSPSSAYQASTSLDPFNVVAENTAVNSGETASLTIRFNYDYSSIAQGNEELIAANFLNHITPNYMNATFSNVQVSEGSILISFDITGDVETVQSLIWEDILDGDLSLTFNGQTLLAEEYLMVDGAPYEPTSTSSGLPIWIIIVVVVVVIVLVAIIIVAVFMVKKNSHGKITQMDEMPLATTKEYGDNSDMKVMSFIGSESSLVHPSLAPTLHFDRTPTPDEGLVNKHLLFDDETDSQRSTLSARSRSPGLHLARRSPEVAVSALPPGFLEGQLETQLADRVKLFIMVKNSDGTFQKLGEVAANMVGTISQLRHDLKDTALPHKVRDKPFVILKETLAEILPGDEKKLMVNEVYSSDCVLLKWVDNEDITQLCICGLVGQFHCSLCQKQTYCSPQCQSTDWPRHSFKCSQWATE